MTADTPRNFRPARTGRARNPARRLLPAALICVGAAVFVTAPPLNVPASGQTASATEEADLPVQEVQQALGLLGYDAGPADGVMGARTVAAIQQFQRENGLPQTGRPDESLYRVLINAVNRSSTGAGEATNNGQLLTAQADQATPTPAAAPFSVPDVAESSWFVINEDGSRQLLRLSAGGGVTGVTNPSFWKWRVEGDRLLIEYDNNTGGWVRRTGRFVSRDRIEGTAESSRDRSWKWEARREG